MRTLESSSREPRQVAQIYAWTVGLVVAVTLLRLPLEPYLHGRAPYALYYIPVVLAALYGGTGPVLVAVGLSLASAWAFVVPRADEGYDLSIALFLVVSGVIGVIARAARTRQDALAFSKAIIDSSDDAIVTKDLDGIIQSWNAGAERLFGYSAAEAIGHPVTMLIPPEHHEEEAKILARLRIGERIDHVETIRIAKGGRRVDVALTISPVRARSGEIIGASKIARDISERKRAAERLAAEREWFARTLESIGDAVVATDESGHVEFLNPVAERLTGWRSDEARGKRSEQIFRIVNESTRKAVESPVERVLASGAVVGLANHTILIAKDGREVPIDDSGAPILGEDGKVHGVVVVFRDVTDRHRAEAERKESLEERERLLASERAARSELESANRSKDEFVAMVSHELRTPLSAILGWTQILKTKSGEPKTLGRGLEVIERNARAQEQLVSDLLDMSRIISGKLTLDVREVDLVTIIQSAIETTRPAAEAKGITIETTLDESLSAAAGDPTRLGQCVWNLLSNAIKFTPQGGRVIVTLGRTESQIEITVSDTGVGIRPDFLPFVFERFRQGETFSTRHAGGLGLGLAIVKQLVELHGGRVRVESAGEGKGATFTITLPIRSLRGQSMPPISLEAPTQLEGVKILLVEDDPDNRDVLRELLEQHHAVVETVGSGREALEALPTVQPNIVVSDIGLPDFDGYELIRRVREGEVAGSERIPAIALTAHASNSDRTKALRAGFQAHLGKPVEARELVAHIVSLTRLVTPSRPPR